MAKQNDFLNIPLLDIKGEEVTLKNLLGNMTFLYFYPKDDTPGCTKEACSVRDNYEQLSELNVKVIGVSKDSVASHQKFQAKHNLNFDLLSDPDHRLQEALGVWQEKKFMGRTYMGTVRMSFLLDEDGEIIKTYPKVDPKTHVGEVIKDIISIKKQ
jgi:peroxiredoxin Q/BCP